MEIVEPKELIEIGERLYGYGWQTRMAEAVGVTPRAMRHWKAGKYPIPEPVARLIRMLDKQSADKAKPPDTAKEGVQKTLPQTKRKK